MARESKPILVGRITGVYGIKGWLKIVSYTRPAEKILEYSPWYIQSGDELREFNVLDSTVTGKSLRVSLVDISDRDLAGALIGSNIFIKRSQLEVLPEGEYYWTDLLGLQVITTDGSNLGVLKDIYETGANDVMVVQGNKRYLIPFVWKHYVLEVDLEEGIIRVDWQEAE